LKKVEERHGSFEFFLFIRTHALKGKIDNQDEALRAHARKGEEPRLRTVKRLRPIYRQAIRLISNGIKIKAISLNACTDIKSNVEVTRGLLLRKIPKTQVPNRHR